MVGSRCAQGDDASQLWKSLMSAATCWGEALMEMERWTRKVAGLVEAMTRTTTTATMARTTTAPMNLSMMFAVPFRIFRIFRVFRFASLGRQRPWYQAIDLRGRPPRAPLARAAEALALLRALPPWAPRRAAIHLREPRKPSRMAGT